MDVKDILNELQKCPQNAKVYCEMIRNENAQIVSVQNLQLQDTDPAKEKIFSPVVVLNCAYFYGMVKDSGYLNNDPTNLYDLIEKVENLLQIISSYSKDPEFNKNKNAVYALTNMEQSLKNVITYFSYMPSNLRDL